jgi:ABC-type multidrug transport system ATPase subunit
MAFVPQDDIVYEDLTVEENVLYATVLFNKRNYRKKRDCLIMTDHIIKLLGIEMVRYSRVGSPEQRGISGGQKKRVSVAIELAKEPALFFLDGKVSFRVLYYFINRALEPTSGLDSASSLSLMYALHRLAANGMTSFSL